MFKFIKRLMGRTTTVVPKKIQQKVNAMPDENIEVRVLADRILQCMPGMSMVVKDTRDLKYLRANSEACDRIGVPEEKLLTRTVHEVMRDEASACLIEAADKEAVKVGKHQMEFWCLMNNGAKRRLSSNRFVFSDTYGSQKQFLITLEQDVTASYSQTMRSEDLERTTTSLLSGLPFPIVWLDRSQMVLGNNLSFNKMVGVEKPVSNMNLIDLFPFVVAERIKAVCRLAEVHNKIMSQQLTLWAYSGLEDDNHREYVIHVCPMHDTHSQVTGTVAAMYDVTDLVRSTVVTDQICHAFNLCSDAVILTNRDNKIVFCNSEFTRQYGWDTEDLLGKTPSIMKSGWHEEVFYRNMWDTLNKGHTWQGTLFDLTRGGRVIRAPTTIVPIMNGSKTPMTFLTIKHTEGREYDDAKTNPSSYPSEHIAPKRRSSDYDA